MNIARRAGAVDGRDRIDPASTHQAPYVMARQPHQAPHGHAETLNSSYELWCAASSRSSTGAPPRARCATGSAKVTEVVALHLDNARKRLANIIDWLSPEQLGLPLYVQANRYPFDCGHRTSRSEVRAPSWR